ncbi:MAG TPA: redoxin domain-containing protein, partial [Anaerolineae bacterium]|nr:redoxin domain-containing protein [Anaerolineae bacterium]
MRDRYEQITTLQAEVVVVSFGNKFWVKVWLEQTQAPFPLLLDEERAAYRAYGLEASKRRAWGV